MPDATSAPRIVPGAPPPPSLSKAQKKKRSQKGKGVDPAPPDSPIVIPDPLTAALVEQAPEPVDVLEGAVAPDLVATESVQVPPSEGDSFDSPQHFAPVLSLIQKRLKASAKKLSRIATYSEKAPAELNEDQLRTLKTLPVLEAVHKELEEIKKGVELLDLEHAKELLQKQADDELAERERLAVALAEAEAANATRTADLLGLLHVHSQLLHSGPSLPLGLNDQERSSIYSTANILLGPHGTSKDSVIRSLLTGEDDIEGIPAPRLFEIVRLHRSNPFDPEPVEVVVEEDDTAGLAVPIAPTTPGSFRFMQDSELDNEDLENSVEWIDREEAIADAPGAVAQTVAEAVIEAAVEAPVKRELEAEPEAALASTSIGSGLNWADDEGGLPSIDSVHATFGTSGTATPTHQQVEAETADVSAATNGAADHHAEIDNDGFTQMRGTRSRGRGMRGGGGGFRGGRGGERGGFRGGDRGNFRGGFRDGGEFRGGEFRGGERGRGRGGRPNGEFGGGWRDSGENRGRGGRGRPRGERGGYRGRGSASAEES